MRLAVRLLKTSIIRQATIRSEVGGYLLHVGLILTNTLYVLGVFHILTVWSQVKLIYLSFKMEILKLKVLTLQKLKLLKVALTLNQLLTMQVG